MQGKDTGLSKLNYFNLNYDARGLQGKDTGVGDQGVRAADSSGFEPGPYFGFRWVLSLCVGDNVGAGNAGRAFDRQALFLHIAFRGVGARACRGLQWPKLYLQPSQPCNARAP